jgi:hypothetical protein
MGSKERLAAELGMPPGQLETYLNSETRLPDKIFLDALDIVAGRKLP